MRDNVGPAVSARTRRLRPSGVPQARRCPLGGAATAQASASGHAGPPPPRPGPLPPGRAGRPRTAPQPHPAGPPTHPCNAPRRSGRASGRCALRRQTGAVSGCARQPGHSEAAGRTYSPSPGEMVSTCTPMAAAAAAADAGRAGGRADGATAGATGGVDRERIWRRFRGCASSLRGTAAHARAPAAPPCVRAPHGAHVPGARAAGQGGRKPGSPEAPRPPDAVVPRGRASSLTFPFSVLPAGQASLTQFPHPRNGSQNWGSASYQLLTGGLISPHLPCEKDGCERSEQMCVHVSVQSVGHDSELYFSALEEASAFTLPCMKPVLSCPNSFIHSTIHSLHTYILIEHLLCAMHCVRCWGNVGKGNSVPDLTELTVSRGRDNQPRR